MTVVQRVRTTSRWLTGGAALAAATYGACAALTWRRYGHPTAAGRDEADVLLDRFMPQFDVVERHRVRVSAPAEVVLAAAFEQDFQASPLIRAIFKGRELILGSTPDEALRPRQMLPLVRSLGWTVLADVPGREIVVGAVTQPWKADVVFRSIPPEEFRGFNEPGYVKIVWTLRADPLRDGGSIFRHETRAVATDAVARTKFRWYWSFLWPGIALIRTAMLRPLKAEAERRAGRMSVSANVAERPGY